MEIAQSDEALRQGLFRLSDAIPNYWDFECTHGRSRSHDYYQYPAMMVPDMLCDLMGIISGTCPSIRTVYDPFSGSGTVQTEAMALGLDFYGADINPLAVLLCRAKSGPFLPDRLEDKADDLLSIIEDDTSLRWEAAFPGLAKWFTPSAIIELSRIRRAIRTEPELWARRFFWVALAETVRLASNSRTSTFKLHIRSQASLQRRLPVRSVFESVLTRNLQNLREETESLANDGFLSRGRYKGAITTALRSALDTASTPKTPCDLLVTSPPYGDNGTTVPYGQSSFLPLQWIDLSDIDRSASAEYLATAYEIDSRSLGGGRRHALEGLEPVIASSPTLASLLSQLERQPRDRRVRVSAFCKDLHRCIDPILLALRKDAYMVWVVGKRRVGGHEVDLPGILCEFLATAGAKEVLILKRQIRSKRMALKNSISRTMKQESILVFRNSRTSGQK